ncbi:hypothetical protein [Streptomyces camelliae]|uniref:Uncharacterized protein n=1 Tax=Streptomyces camelliae TaxID=3004093 RepID=A0ABY7PGK5_9ACTN|nr:hypothetical protein [Streptomyces sp. HUAS 2-6]WBO68757.1 hypothetical protein O1G22_41125 [Streptomyces sp. HUAS 2-6]
MVVRRLLAILLLLLFPGVDPGTQILREEAREGVGGHLLRMQHARFGHIALVADDLWQRIGRGSLVNAMLLVQSLPQPTFLVGGAGARFAVPCGSQDLPPPVSRALLSRLTEGAATMATTLTAMSEWGRA